ncbi:MAG: hypothetical protein IJQ76_10000 [Prevotella sp.]|nr:hypothetical protein [Prevotella sp.]MBR0276518.1 hypothetical protein [Prevotella sp.]
MPEDRNLGKRCSVVQFIFFYTIAVLAIGLALLVTMALTGCQHKDNASSSKITAEMAFEGVSNYCHSAYDWSAAEENPDIMGLEMGEETDSAYHVVFRSYTGALVNFYVDKASGTTRMVEYVPALGWQEEAGTMNLFEYLKQ